MEKKNQVSWFLWFVAIAFSGWHVVSVPMVPFQMRSAMPSDFIWSVFTGAVGMLAIRGVMEAIFVTNIKLSLLISCVGWFTWVAAGDVSRLVAPNFSNLANETQREPRSLGFGGDFEQEFTRRRSDFDRRRDQFDREFALAENASGWNRISAIGFLIGFGGLVIHGFIALYEKESLMQIFNAPVDSSRNTAIGNATIATGGSTVDQRGKHIEQIAASPPPKADETNRNATQVFVSYSHADEEMAQNLSMSLKREGINTFLASSSITAGDRFADRIQSALNAANEVWLLVTPNSLESEWVTTEWGAAWAMGKRVVPILHECSKSDLPERLAALQTIQLSRVESEIQQLRGRLKAVANS